MSSKVSKGKTAITHYENIFNNKFIGHIKVTLETGRTHQIRVHLAQELNSAIVNDYLYGNPIAQKKRLPKSVAELLENYEHPMLHAKHLGFIHPITKEHLSFTVDAPDIFQKVISLTSESSCE